MKGSELSRKLRVVGGSKSLKGTLLEIERQLDYRLPPHGKLLSSVLLPRDTAESLVSEVYQLQMLADQAVEELRSRTASGTVQTGGRTHGTTDDKERRQ